MNLLKLREIRKMAGLTQEELGSKMGVSAPMVSQWETGKEPLSLERLEQFYTVCGQIPDQSLFTETETTLRIEGAVFAQVVAILRQHGHSIATTKGVAEMKFQTYGEPGLNSFGSVAGFSSDDLVVTIRAGSPSLASVLGSHNSLIITPCATPPEGVKVLVESQGELQIVPSGPTLPGLCLGIVRAFLTVEPVA